MISVIPVCASSHYFIMSLSTYIPQRVTLYYQEVDCIGFYDIPLGSFLISPRDRICTHVEFEYIENDWEFSELC